MPIDTPNPAHGLRALACHEHLGLTFVEWKTDANEDALANFAEFLTNRVAKSAEYDVELDTAELPNLGGLPVNWKRRRFCVFPIFIEKLVIADTVIPNVDGLELRIERQGEWHVTPATLESCRIREAAWDALIDKRADWSLSGGLSVNLLELPQDALKTGEVDLRPLMLHALRPDGGATDRGRVSQQLAVANSFWQTFWATGALRSQRGIVFPIAFLPIDRSWCGEFKAPFDTRRISDKQTLYGRTSILARLNEILTTEKALLFDTDKCLFGVAADFDATLENLSTDDMALALAELNRTAFVDAYTGDNKTTFARWHTMEEDAGQGEPFCAENTVPPPAILDRHNESVFEIRRVVPFSGAAYLSQVVHETQRLMEDGKIQDFDGEIVAATNSTFFLNFPEEYCNLHTAMNDPVSVLVENGHTRHITTLRRATFALAQDGEARITVDAANSLHSDALCECADRANAFTTAHKPGAENRFGPAAFGAVVIGDAIVETFTGYTDIPANAFILGTDNIRACANPANAVSVKIPTLDGSRELPLRHAFAVGPLLLKNSQPVPFGTSGEEFLPIHLHEPMSAEETADLPRAAMPSALRTCIAKGTPPTRFPHDWNKTRAPRTGLGVKPDGTVVLAVVDGRADLSHSIGVTLAELAQVMLNLGCCEAMNMDGGGSSVMFINDAAAAEFKLRPELRDGVVNLPSDAGGVERMLPVPLVLTRQKTGAH